MDSNPINLINFVLTIEIKIKCYETYMSLTEKVSEFKGREGDESKCKLNFSTNAP